MQAKNEQLVNNINDIMIDLRNTIIKIEVSENENPNKIVDIAEKILDFNKQKKGKGIKVLTPKQMLRRLPIALVQVKVGNRSENLPNAIHQIMYSSYQENKITKRVYNNIMNSVNLL